MGPMLAVFVAIVCVLANGFFVAAEFALAKVRPTALAALASQGDGRARLAFELTKKLDAYLAATQLGITLASLGLGWIGEPAIATFIEPPLTDFGFSPQMVHGLSLGIAFSIITVLHIIVGELLPKSVAIQHPENVSRRTAGALRVFFYVFYPALFVLNGLSNFILRRLGLPPAEHAEGKLSVEEIRLVLRASFAGQGSDHRKREILERVLRGVDRPVRSIMVPRVDMVTVSLERSVEECLSVIRKNGYSRYPVSESNEADKIVGYLHVKDLLLGPTAQKELASCKRDIFFVPDSRTVGDLLGDFQREGIPMAVVVDEFGGTAGLVTVEDTVEAIVGELRDEFDREGQPIEERGDGSFTMSGALVIEEISLPGFDPGDATDGDTIGGRIISALGRMPRPGDRVTMGAYEAVVEEVVGRRIGRVALKKLETEKAEA